MGTFPIKVRQAEIDIAQGAARRDFTDGGLHGELHPLQGVDTGDMQVIPVKTFDDALQALQPSDATG